MAEKNELNLEELEKVAGGEFDEECDKWVRRNYNTILDRARENSIVVRTSQLIAIQSIKTEVITIAELKQILKDNGVDCDDLM